VLVYKLENGMSTSRYESSPADTAIAAMTGVGLFMVVLLMTILAGSSISNEISTGSIKSLIISPARRWKIYTAKLVSLLSTGVLMTLLLYGVAMLDHGVFFGFGAGQPYVYAHNGTAGEMGFHLYQFARLWVQFLDVAVYMCLAFMLSILTRNTAVSVGLSIAVYFSSSVIRAFLTLYRGHEWVRFIPFSNMGLAARMFPYDNSQETIGFLFGSVGVQGAPPVGFSLVYLAVLVFCMGFIGLDSFCRRDIK
jgi:ABC-2 type transport system permease protein